MKKAMIMDYDINGRETGEHLHTVYTKQEVIEYMQDKNKKDYAIDLFAPDWYKYNESLLEDSELYLIEYSEWNGMMYIQLFLKEEYEISGGKYYE